MKNLRKKEKEVPLNIAFFAPFARFIIDIDVCCVRGSE